MLIEISNGVGKIRGLSEPVKASLAFMVSSIIQKGIGFLTTPIFTRLMSTEEYGTYSLYLSWYSMVIIISSLNLSVAYNNALIKYEMEERRVQSSFLGISTSITAVLFIVCLFSPEYWSAVLGLPYEVVLLILLQCLLEPAFQLWSTRERFFYKYKRLIFCSLFITIGSPLLGIMMVCCSGDKVLARVSSNIIICGIIYLCAYIASFIKGKCFFSARYWKMGISMCIPLIPHFFSQTILNQSDRIMIGKMVGDNMTAVYSVAYTIATVVSIIITSINNSLLPYTYRCLKEHDSQMKHRINKLVVIVAVLSFITMLFGPEFIWVIGGKEYFSGIWVVPSVTVGTYFTFVYSVFANVEYYYEKTVYMSVGSIMAAIINVILNYMLIPVMGYVVAGYTTLFGFIVLSIIHYICYKKIIGKQEWATESIIDIKVIFFISLAMICIMVLTLLLYKMTIVRYVVIGVIGIICVLYRNKFKKIIGDMQKRRKVNEKSRDSNIYNRF